MFFCICVKTSHLAMYTLKPWHPDCQSLPTIPLIPAGFWAMMNFLSTATMQQKSRNVSNSHGKHLHQCACNGGRKLPHFHGLRSAKCTRSFSRKLSNRQISGNHSPIKGSSENLN